MPAPSTLPPQLTLLASTTLYPLLFYLSTPHHPTPTRFLLTRQALSTLHSSLLTALSLLALYRFSLSQTWCRAASHQGRPASAGAGGDGDADGRGKESQHPLIAARSVVANCLTAWEAGFLLQDTGILLVGTRLARGLYGGAGGINSGVAKGKGRGLDVRVQALHHVAVGGALGMLQWYIARGRERGVWVVVMFLLMNASTPLLNLRWYMNQYHPRRRRALQTVNAAFLLVFPVCRICLIYYVLRLYGSYYGESALQAFRKKLLLPCRMGTGALALMNTVWWLTAARNTAWRLGWSFGKGKNRRSTHK